MHKESIMTDFRASFGLDDDYPLIFKGYIVFLPNNEEFLSIFEDQEDVTAFGYGKNVSSSKVFQHHSQAISVAKRITKYKTEVCALMETDDQYATYPIWKSGDREAQS